MKRLFISDCEGPISKNDNAYELKIEGESLGIYTPLELAEGVNISKPMRGPLWDQALSVMQATQDRALSWRS